MKQYVLEIVRQKWRLFSVILTLLLLNGILAVVVSTYQLPAMAELQTKWANMRSQAASTGMADAATLYRQGAADLEKLQGKIPEKRQFAGVLNDLLDAAASSDVKVGAISYIPVKVKEEPLLSYELTLSVSGSYAAVKSYLADLQDDPALIVVDSVTFSNSDPFVENVSMNLHLTLYLREGA